MINCSKIMLFLLATVLPGIGFVNNATAQNEVDILQADRIQGGTVEDKKVQKILGNVHLKSDDFEMYTDSAYQFVNENEIRAYGNVEIDTPDEQIWADSLVYFNDVDFTQLRGRVIIDADSTTIFGESVDYRFSTKVANFLDGIRLEDQQGVLKADSGFYYREADSAVFRGQVQVSDSTQYIEGDSLFTNRSKEYYELHGDIFADDIENNTLLKGDYLEADSTGRRLVEGNAWLRNIETDTTTSDSVAADTTSRPPPTTEDTTRADSLSSTPTDTTQGRSPPQARAQSDTTHIRSKKIIANREITNLDTTAIVNAFEDVRIWSTRFSSVSDTALYDDSKEIFELWSNAMAWYEDIQLTGPYIKVTLRDGNIDQLTSYPEPFVVQEDTIIDRLNQIKGDSLNAYFEDGTMSMMELNNNTEVLNFTKNSEDEPDGAIESQAPESIFLFEDGDLVEFKQNGEVTGDYLPEDGSLQDRQLDGFSWNPDQRPRRPEEVMEPRFTPIPDERPFVLPQRFIQYLRLDEPE